jgi:hypothetical protein
VADRSPARRLLAATPGTSLTFGAASVRDMHGMILVVEPSLGTEKAGSSGGRWSTTDALENH